MHTDSLNMAVKIIRKEKNGAIMIYEFLKESDRDVNDLKKFKHEIADVLKPLMERKLIFYACIGKEYWGYIMRPASLKGFHEEVLEVVSKLACFKNMKSLTSESPQCEIFQRIYDRDRLEIAIASFTKVVERAELNQNCNILNTFMRKKLNGTLLFITDKGPLRAFYDKKLSAFYIYQESFSRWFPSEKARMALLDEIEKKEMLYVDMDENGEYDRTIYKKFEHSDKEVPCYVIHYDADIMLKCSTTENEDFGLSV